MPLSLFINDPLWPAVYPTILCFKYAIVTHVSLSFMSILINVLDGNSPFWQSKFSEEEVKNIVRSQHTGLNCFYVSLMPF